MSYEVGAVDWAAVVRQAIKKLAPTARPKAAILDPVAKALPAMFTHYAITTPRRQSHFLAQAIHECDYFQTLEEYASGDAYDQRTDMGFTAAKDGDGRRNKGFGIIQTTGPNNQRRALKALLALGFEVSQDVSKAKAVLTDPTYAAWVAGIWWNDNKGNAVADRDKDGTLCSRLVNRGNANSTKPAYHEAERKAAFRAVWATLQNPPLIKATAPVAFVSREIIGTVETRFPKAGQGEGIQLPMPPGSSPKPGPAQNPAGGEEIEAPEIQGQDAAALGKAIQDGLTGAPGQDPAEHQAQVAEGKQPDAAPPSPSTPLPAEPVAPAVPPGMVAATQQRFRDLGFYLVGQPNGDAGARTVAAIAAFQHVAGLPVTGQLDATTMTAAWADDAPHAPLDPERAMATAADLRPTSAIVDATAKAKAASMWQILAGGGMAAGTAVVSGFSGMMSQLQPLRETFEAVPGWGWGVVVLLVLTVPSVYAYVQSQRAQAARVEDHNTGKTA